MKLKPKLELEQRTSMASMLRIYHTLAKEGPLIAALMGDRIEQHSWGLWLLLS